MAGKKKNRNTRRDGNGQIIVSQEALSYKGPSRMIIPKNKIPDDSVVVQLTAINSVVSNGSGVINTVFDSANQAQAASDWSQFAALYSEFRVLSMDLELLPWNRYNLPTTTVAAPLYVVEDRVSNTAINSLATVAGYDQFKAFLPSTHVRMVMRMSGTGEAAWSDVTTTPSAADRMFIKLCSLGNTASTTYYDYVDRVMVQFRNRK